MATVVRTLSEDPGFDVELCVVQQQAEILDAALAEWQLEPDVRLHLDRSNPGVAATLVAVISAVAAHLDQSAPDMVLVQGDTTTAIGASLAAFYAQVPLGHVEAGLRSGDVLNPFPEEMHRVLADSLASVHYAPTHGAKQNLLDEGYPAENVMMVGNTVVDALFQMRDRCRNNRPLSGDSSRKMLLVTGHRRENFGHGLTSICNALRTLVTTRDDVEIVYVLHPHPAASGPAKSILEGVQGVTLVEPQDYERFVDLLDRCFLVITDSGGIQEEAPYLGKPVLVTRETTERPEAMKLGLAWMVGTHHESIVAAVTELIEDPARYEAMTTHAHPYGDGNSAHRIHADIGHRLGVLVPA